MVSQGKLIEAPAPVHGSSTHAFTLVELMATVVVLCVVTLMGLPLLVKANQKTKGVNCRNNLRQAGLALQSYSDLNDGWLPGPVNSLVAARYDLTSTNELAWFLAERLGCPSPTGRANLAPQFLCPGHSERRPQATLTARDYLSNDGTGLSVAPFGKAGPGSTGPVKLEALGAATRLQDCPALTDADKANINPTLPGWAALPYRPVHGNNRNVLFFDGHVGNKQQ
jgi:prepilin-type processing-associated H-X9-DG protein/prepilin-type N-terminal cleavage/methylation domain-containing protein